MRINREATKRQPGLKGFLFWWLESENNPRQFFVSIFLNVIIILSIVVLLFEELLPASMQKNLELIDDAFLIFFICEYLIRIFIGTDFTADITEKGILHAIKNKLVWMTQFFHIIDFIAILPVLRFLRILRTLRLIRFLRFLRFFRALKIFRNFGRFLIFLRAMGSSARFLLVLGLMSLVAVLLLSFGVFVFEGSDTLGFAESFSNALLFTLNKVGFVDLSLGTIGGKVVSSLILFANMLIFSFLISIITTQMGEVMQNIKEGKLGKLSLSNHLILCGYTKTTEIVIENIINSGKYTNKIVLITDQSDIDIPGVLYMKGDYSKLATLENANISKAKIVVVFSEKKNDYEDQSVVDLRTTLTVFHIEKAYPEVHTIAEINEKGNEEVILERMKGDEIIFKEQIDANLIVSSILHQNISPILYELTDLKGRKIEQVSAPHELKEYGMEHPLSVKAIKLASIENDFTFLGIIQKNGEAILSPSSNQEICEEDKLLLII